MSIKQPTDRVLDSKNFYNLGYGLEEKLVQQPKDYYETNRDDMDSEDFMAEAEEMNIIVDKYPDMDYYDDMESIIDKYFDVPKNNVTENLGDC